MEVETPAHCMEELFVKTEIKQESVGNFFLLPSVNIGSVVNAVNTS